MVSNGGYDIVASDRIDKKTKATSRSDRHIPKTVINLLILLTTLSIPPLGLTCIVAG